MNETQFDSFYQSSFTRIVGQIYALCGNLQSAQDATQEAFVRAWDKRGKLRSADSPEAWVRTTAYRIAVSEWRSMKRAQRQPDRAVEYRRPAEPNPNAVALAAALAKLPSDQRRALVLYHMCDLSVAQVAKEVGAPEGTVKARLSRGRQALAALLGQEARV
ncbi:RNA polymerase sigma factor [Tessaracoccus sp. OH4464_COT-324]|uniref:RNA polymerase sigma factor n=1 Tax=Tessaracoccus sp. OH4464_COT-324 TaxID=2491059 RepID=UPI000F632B6E|nr:sigma-70 family RNA polymerase sigma factor [Tessaracoccus sp. OH4464_COT-324]RRD46855.1 sigma-70 family RNA polymerase sigma factor [Tessaracoccus sp. OH4464_COT-324]